jgi:hypothetical protein
MSRLTFQTLYELSQKLAGNDTSTASTTFFKQRINARAEEVLSKLPSYLSEITGTFSTVEDQTYYHYPPNIKGIKSLVITIGDVSYPLTPIHSNFEWEKLNALDIQPSAIPVHYFKRQRDFGIYPTPQDAYDATIVYNIRAGGMTKTDFEDGTVTVTENDETVTLAGDTWTASEAAADMWFSLTDGDESRGSWYRIASRTSTTVIELESVYEETTEAGASFLIGESPELPEDLHELLAFGAVADYYAGFRQSLTKAQNWENKFYTGDFSNTSRNSTNVKGGLIDAIRRYQDRNESQLINRRTKLADPRLRVWGSTLS